MPGWILQNQRKVREDEDEYMKLVGEVLERLSRSWMGKEGGYYLISLCTEIQFSKNKLKYVHWKLGRL